MRSSLLLHPIAAWRQHEQSSRPAGGDATGPGHAEDAARGMGAPTSARAALVEDAALARGRAAGGPVDEACYPCSCGYFFIAPVSANVTCPHCGATQAW